MSNVGNKSAQMPGAAVALNGESEIRGQSTGVDILTLTAPSSMDANFIRVRSLNAADAASTKGVGDVFVVTSNGGLGTHKWGVVTGSTVSATLGTTCYGQVYSIDTITAGTAVALSLPAPEVGAVVTFTFKGNSSAAVIINTTAADKFILHSAAVDGVNFTSGDLGGFVFKVVGSSLYWHPILYTQGSSLNANWANIVCTASS